MMKNKKLLLGVGAVCLALCLGVALLIFGGGVRDAEPDPVATSGAEILTYTVQVKNQGGLFLKDVGVYIYEDATAAELVWFAKTDDSGKMTFTGPARDSYVAVLQDVPTGYAVEDMYPITGELTEIVLSAAQMSEDETVVYKLGDMMMDFTVEDAQGDTYTLSKLLETKKAVVLNFWFTTCQPCKAEFPFLQEAYEKYKDDIEVLAMNPLNTAEEVEAFKKELGLKIPMMACDAKWEDMLQLTAYPTTVVIDRFGNIALIHTGSIDKAKTFEDAFAYFAAEDYTQKLIKDIAELAVEEEEGSKENPVEIAGVLNFDVTVKPGETVYTEVYKVTGMYMQVQGKDFKLLYNEKEYEPKNGVAGVVITTGDTRTPAVFGITNTGKEEAAYKVAFSFLPGTMDNPYAMKMEEFQVNISAGNEKGVYYVYTAAEDGMLTVQCLGVTSGVKYSYNLYNLETSALRTLEDDGQTDEEGIPTLSVPVKKGQKVQLIVATLPDASNNYPAATFRLRASFENGEIKEEEQVETIPYTVTVKDSEGNPIANVGISLQVGEEKKMFSTDETGLASIQLEPGAYQGSFTVPEGYDKVENTAFQLTAEKTSHEIVLTKTVIVIHDYKVVITDKTGKAVAGVKVKIGNTIVTTDKDGCAVFTMEEGSYTASLQALPEDYIAEKDSYDFPQGKTRLDIKISIKPGTVGNPYEVTEYPADTVSIEAGSEVHYTLKNAGGMVLNINNAAACVMYNGTAYAPVEGKIAIRLADTDAPITLAIGNTGETAMAFKLRLSYPVGAKENPEALELGEDTLSLAAGDTKGYYYTWTAEQDGTVCFAVKDITDGAAADIILTLGETSVKLSDTAEASMVSLWVNEGDVLTAQVITLPDAQTEEIPAAEITVESSFRLPANSEAYPDVLTDISSIDVTLAEGDSDGWFYIWTPANSGVASFKLAALPDGVNADIILKATGKDTVVKLSDGMTDTLGQPVAAITVERGQTLSICVTADAKAAQLTVNGSLAQDPNSAENPDDLTDITSVTANLVAGDADGHYYAWTATDAGTLSVSIDSITAGVQGSISLFVGGTEYPMTGSVASAQVKEGDEVLLHVKTLANSQTGEYPAARIAVKSSFAYALGSARNPEVVTSVEKLTASMEAGNAKGYYYSWTAEENCTAVFHISGYSAAGRSGGDYTQWADIVLYLNGQRQTSLSENESMDANGNRIVSVTAKKGDIVTVQVLTKSDADGKHPAATVEISSYMEFTYTVKVTDMFGKAQSGVNVTVWNSEGQKVHTGVTDESGLLTMKSAAGNYRVELAFEGTAYYYDTATAVLSAQRTSVTIQLANYLDTSKPGTKKLYVLNGAKTYLLEQGGTYIETNSGKVYYCVEPDMEGYCMFVFTPTTGGTYKFAVNNPNAEIVNFNTPNYTAKIDSSIGSEDNSVSCSVGYSTIENSGGYNMVIGVKVAEGTEGVVVSISRVGEPDWSVESEPWSEEWKHGHTHTDACTLTGNVTYVDINAASGKYELYYNETTGFYQLYQNGPVVYVDMDHSLLSFYKIIKGDGVAGGAPIRKYFYDSDGKFIKKEDYTDTFVEYFNLDENDVAQSKYHPLTKELMYMIQQGGGEWWNPNSPSCNETLIAANPEYAWMFAFCYLP